MCLWGRCPHLRRVSRPAPGSTRPRKFFNARCQPRLNGIVDDVSLDTPELVTRSHQVIVALILPKWLPCSSQQLVDLSRAKSFQPSHKSGYINPGCEQQVNVISHDHPRVQITVSLGAVLDGTPNQFGHFRPFQMNRSEPRGIQQSIHSHKPLAGSQAFLRKFAANRQTTIQPKRDKDRLSNRVNVRQPAV